MEDEALDDALFLRLLRDIDNRLRHVAIARVFLRVVLEPGFSRREVTCVLILIKELDACAAYRDRDNPDGHVGHAVGHRTPEPVGNGNRVAAVKERWHRRVDLAQRVAALARALLRRENLEARVFGLVGALGIGSAAHVGLPVRDVDVEIGVRSSACRRGTERKNARGKARHGRKPGELFKKSHTYSFQTTF